MKPGELAEKIGVSRPGLLQWENGETKEIKARNLFKAAHALKKNPEWLITGEGSEDPIEQAPAERRHALPENAVEIAQLYLRMPRNIRDRLESFMYLVVGLEQLGMHVNLDPTEEYLKYERKLEAHYNGLEHIDRRHKPKTEKQKR